MKPSSATFELDGLGLVINLCLSFPICKMEILMHISYGGSED